MKCCGNPERLSIKSCDGSQGLEFKVVQLVAVLHDVALNLGRVDPGHKVLHVPAI